MLDALEKIAPKKPAAKALAKPEDDDDDDDEDGSDEDEVRSIAT